MPNSNINITTLDSKDWQKYKEIRLEMLAGDDSQFGWNIEEALDLTDQQWQQMAKSCYIIAMLESLIVGVVNLSFTKAIKKRHVAEIGSVFVKPEYRGQGVARSLFQELERIAKSKGVEILKLTVLTNNISAKTLYEKIGFIKTGDIPKSLKNKGIYYDEILMQKQI